MKKVIITVSIMALLVCFFALGVSAAGAATDAFGEVTVIEGVDAPTLLDTTSRVVILASDGTYYTFPSYYILEDNATFRWKSNSAVNEIIGRSGAANGVYRPYVVRMEIPEGITAINPGGEGGAYAFEDATKLVEITLPSTLTVLGNYAFNRDKALTTLNGFTEFMTRATKIGTMMLSETAWGQGIDVVIPTTITNVPERCFYGTKINSVTFHDGVTALGTASFQNCVNLTSVVLPKGLVNLGAHSFAACSALESISTEGCTSIKTIGEYCFEKTPVKIFDFTPFAATLESISAGLFNECSSLTAVPGYGDITCATEVGDKMFNKCSSLKAITFPADITRIGVYAFAGFKGETVNVVIPDTVTAIGQRAFEGSNIVSITLPSSLTSLANHVFANCSSLVSIDTQKSTGLKTIGEYCIEHCKSLTSFDFTPFANVLENPAAGIFNGCKALTTVTGLEKTRITIVSSSMFKQCPLTNILLPETVMEIGGYAFYQHNSSQAELRIPNSVQAIGDHAFTRGNKGGNGTRIYLPASLKTLSEAYTFENWLFAEMYIPAGVEKIPAGIGNNNSATGVVFFYTGDIDTLTISETNNSILLNAQWISADEFTGASDTCNYIVYNYNPCDAFYKGVHTFGDLTMNFVSYFERITFSSDCTVCKENKVDESATIEPMFSYLGYSISEVELGGGFAMAQSFAMDKAAIEKYEAYVGREISFGVIAAGNENGAEISPELGGKYVVSHQFDKNMEYKFFDVKISNIIGDNASRTVAFCAYVIDGENMFYLNSVAVENEGEISFAGTTATTVVGYAYNELFEILQKAK
ncbi:MAG: leucine-rich repeat protein [Clostridia bacterium]|nr:leucine-rich repeat protein [Clostridia bacterium]